MAVPAVPTGYWLFQVASLQLIHLLITYDPKGPLRACLLADRGRTSVFVAKSLVKSPNITYF